MDSSGRRKQKQKDNIGLNELIMARQGKTFCYRIQFVVSILFIDDDQTVRSSDTAHNAGTKQRSMRNLRCMF